MTSEHAVNVTVECSGTVLFIVSLNEDDADSVFVDHLLHNQIRLFIARDSIPTENDGSFIFSFKQPRNHLHELRTFNLILHHASTAKRESRGLVRGVTLRNDSRVHHAWHRLIRD